MKSPLWLKSRTLVSGLVFLVIPTVFVITISKLTKAKGPQWLPFTFENPYNYLFNSLLLLKGQAPYSIDHPGTTTQMFGATILRASSLASNDDLIKSVLQNPEYYIQILHWALLIFTVLVLWLVPWLTAEAIRNRIIGILIQAPSLFFSTLLWYGILFGPDLMLVPFSIAAVCCCVLLLVPSSVPEKSQILFGVRLGSPTPDPPRFLRLSVLLLPVLSGLVCALGIVTKLTFFPLVLISLLCCRSRKNLLAFTISFVLGLALALLPIYSQLLHLATWTFNLGIHSGRYDSGEIGLPPSDVYLSSLSNLVQTEPLVLIIPIVATIVLLAFSLLSRNQPHTNEIAWSTALFLFAIQAISLLVIAKEIGPHYLIPVSLTTGLSLVFLFLACRSVDRSKLKRIVGWITLVGLLALGGKSSFERTREIYEGLKEQKLELLRLYRHAEEVTRNDVRVDYFFSDSPVYPLCYGNEYSGRAFGPLLLTLYPNKLFLNVYNSRFETFTEWITPEVILKKYDHLYFFGKTKWLPQLAGFEPDEFETIDEAGDYSLQKWTRK